MITQLVVTGSDLTGEIGLRVAVCFGGLASVVDLAVEIPMIGISASLNVAVAGSLVLYRLAGLC